MITIQIGKNGVSEGLLDHVKDACETNEAIKLNFLRSYTATNTVEEGVERITAYLDPLYDVDYTVRGHTATLHIKET